MVKQQQPLPEQLSRLVRSGPTGSEIITLDNKATVVKREPHSPFRQIAFHDTGLQWLSDVAFSPDGNMLAIAGANSSLQLWSTRDLALIAVIPCAGDGKLVSLAFSRNGQWVAVADDQELVHLIDIDKRSKSCSTSAGERTLSVAFHPNLPLLVCACSFQGGSSVSVFSITCSGQLVLIQTIDRSIWNSPPLQFVDTITDIAFSEDGRLLAFVETASVDQEAKPIGWRGNLVVYNIDNWQVIASVSLDANITGDPANLATCGYPLGFPAKIAFTTPSAVLVGLTSGLLIGYDVCTREILPIRFDPSATVLSLALSVDRQYAFVCTSAGKIELVMVSTA